tara:strand:- start:10111 stop:11052 length:942 start_codon:yes stop_codon:yes gene_type:complete
MDYILFTLGALFIFYGSNLLIDNSKLIAVSLSISPFVIGLTLIAFGTSLPELIVSTIASFEGEGDIVIGNIIGSNIANIALVLSIIAIWRPVKFNYKNLKGSLNYIVISSIILGVIVANNYLSLIPGIVFLILFIIYIYNQFKVVRAGSNQENSKDSEFNIKYLIYSFLGIFLLGYGADLFINGAIGIATSLGVPLIVISLSVVALGTSIPELVTSMVAIQKNESNFVIGNILGSNIINIVFVLGTAIIINPINTFTPDSLIIYNTKISLFFMFLVTAILLYIIFFKNKVNRFYGIILLLVYFTFIYLNFIQQ